MTDKYNFQSLEQLESLVHSKIIEKVDSNLSNSIIQKILLSNTSSKLSQNSFQRNEESQKNVLTSNEIGRED